MCQISLTAVFQTAAISHSANLPNRFCVRIPFLSSLKILNMLPCAEDKGFEPLCPDEQVVFETTAIDHSANLPNRFCVRIPFLSSLKILNVLPCAEDEGFEPPYPLRDNLFSRQAQSTTLPIFQYKMTPYM